MSRDLFVQRLHRFILINRKVSQSEADYLNSQDGAVDTSAARGNDDDNEITGKF